jgi:hypothetical protein
VQLEADGQLHLQVRDRSDPAVEHLLVSLVSGVRGMVLPDRPMRSGRQWRGVAELRAGIGLGDAATTVAARTTYRVDSIVARSHDTLAHIRVAGGVSPINVRTRDGEVLDYRGVVSGSIVWSTGWSGVVSAALRVTVLGTVQGRAAEDVNGRVRVERTLRQAVIAESP